jgi:polysaccharide biosynthesis/export protein
MLKSTTLILCFSFLFAASVFGDYLIGAGDSLQIFVWQEPNLTVTIPVRPDGKITVPLAGEILAEKTTTTQLTELIKSKLEKYIKSPMVTVILASMNSNVIYATGGVKKPGEYTLTRSITLLQFISLVGGCNEFAKKSKAYIVRGNEKIKVNIKKLMKKVDLEQNIIMEKGDVLVVPE